MPLDCVSISFVCWMFACLPLFERKLDKFGVCEREWRKMSMKNEVGVAQASAPPPTTTAIMTATTTPRITEKSGTKKIRLVAKVQDDAVVETKRAQRSLSLYGLVHVLLCWWESGTIQYPVCVDFKYRWNMAQTNQQEYEQKQQQRQH